MKPIVKFYLQNKDLIGDMDPVYFQYFCNVSLKNRFIYFATPKVGCSTALLTLQRAELEDPSFVPAEFEDIHERELSPLLRPSQVGSFSSLLTSPGYLKFCLVRNPFTRILSCYLDKIVGGHPHKQVILQQLGRPVDDLSQTVTFEEFVDAIASQSITSMHDHWWPQWFHLSEGRIKFDIIGRFESFANDFEMILDRISVDFRKYYVRETRNATGSKRQLQKYYDQRLVELVRQIYAVDFLRYGYPLGLPA